MKNKTLGILLIILVALTAGFLLQKYFGRASSSVESFSELKIKFDPQSVNTIQVFKQAYPDSGLYFARKDTGWVISNEFNAPAKNADVSKLIAELDTVTGSIRAETPDLYPDFDITDEKALQIKLLDISGSTLVHVFVGKGGQSGKDCFVRIAGDPKVYLADNNFISRFAAWNAEPSKRLPTNRWLELSVCSLKRDEINSIKIHTPKADYDFVSMKPAQADSTSPTPPQATWEQIAPTKGTKLDDSKIRGILGGISGLRATGVSDPANRDKFGLPNSQYNLWAGDSLGRSTLIKFSDKINEAEDRYVAIEGNPNLFIVNKPSFERFFVTPFEKPKEPVKTKEPINSKTK